MSNLVHHLYIPLYVASNVVLEYKERSMITMIITDMPKTVTKEESNLVSTALIPVVPAMAALSNLVERLLRATLGTRNRLKDMRVVNACLGLFLLAFSHLFSLLGCK